MNIVLYYIVSRATHWRGGGGGTSYINIYTEVLLEYVSLQILLSQVLSNWKEK